MAEVLGELAPTRIEQTNVMQEIRDARRLDDVERDVEA